MDPLFISLVSACTALFASVVGPLVTLTVAKRQFNASVLSANRQRWIESLRDLLAEFTSLVLGVVMLKRAWKYDWQAGMIAAATDPAGEHGIGAQLNRKAERLAVVYCKIRLLTNPNEPDHQELCRLIEQLLENLKQAELPPEPARASIEQITRLSQTILKREWERVKQGV